MKEAHYQLTLNEEQAKLVSRACEFYARIRMGQFGEIIWHCAEGRVVDDMDAAGRLWLELRRHIYPDLSMHPGHSYGIGKFEDADLTYDVHQVLDFAMGGKKPFSYNALPDCKRIEV